jgi:hypothetical protein
MSSTRCVVMPRAVEVAMAMLPVCKPRCTSLTARPMLGCDKTATHMPHTVPYSDYSSLA